MNFYKTKDGGYMSVGSLEPKFWKQFCIAIGREDLTEGSVWAREYRRGKG